MAARKKKPGRKKRPVSKESFSDFVRRRLTPGAPKPPLILNPNTRRQLPKPPPPKKKPSRRKR